MLLTRRYVPESKAAHARSIDPVGQMLVFTGLATLTYAIIEIQHAGLRDSRIVALFGAAAVSFALLLWYEPRRAEPLLDLRFFRSVPFSSATVIAVCSFASFSAFLFLNALYLQQVRGFSAFHAGLSTLPLALMMVVCAPLSGRLVGSFGTRPSLLIAGSALLASALLLTRLTASTPLLMLYASYVLFGIGIGMVNPPIGNSAVAGMPRAQAGVAAAIASTSRQVGAGLGVAIAGTVLAASRAHHMAFTEATHPIWWIMTACAGTIIAAGALSTTEWARRSASSIAFLLDPAA